MSAGAQDQPGAANPAPEAARAAPAPAAAKEAPAAKEATPMTGAVAAVMETKPTTPVECVRAAKVLMDLGRADLAKNLLTKVLDAKLDQRQLADLSEQIGTAILVDLTTHGELQPEARQLSDEITAAVKARLQDPERLAGLIRQLQDPSMEKRGKAVLGLQEAGEAAICPLVQVLADPARTAEQANVRTVLAGMGRPARDVLMGVVERADPNLTVQAILTLGEMNDPRAEPCLLAPYLAPGSNADVRTAAAGALRQLEKRLPTRAEAVRLLSDLANGYFRQRQLIEGAIEGKVALWRWDEAAKQCTSKTYAVNDASRMLAARWAHDAFLLAPDAMDLCSFDLATMLEVAAYEKGLDQPLDENDPAVVQAKQFGVRAVEDTLTCAMAHGHPVAATVAVRLLGQIGKADDLLYEGAEPAPFARALRQPDRRLRMAALEAIARLRPGKPFSGSSYVPAALQFFAASSGRPHALAAGANAGETHDLAGMLSAAGYETDSAATGKELLSLAARSPDYELAMIDTAITRPEINMLLQQLRHDERTASLRVGLLARDGHLEEAERLARQDPLAMAFSRPHDDQSLRWQISQLATLAPREFVSFETRQQQAAEALGLWAELGKSPGGLYDLRRVQDAALAALYNAKLAAKAVAVLANTNSAESQRALVEVASRFTQPLELRNAAARAFCQNVEKHGILLTSEEIRAQYRRYNESEYLDAPTQHVLGMILDCLEASAQPGKPRG